jgi:8-amino-7-oxononanoate synthase
VSNEKITSSAKAQLIQRILGRQPQTQDGASTIKGRSTAQAPCQFDDHPEYKKIILPMAAARRLGVENPFFKTHDACAGATTEIAGQEYLNFSSYNYLGLCGHPLINAASKNAIDHYGTSASASRLVSGERPIQQELERALADNYGVEAALVFVSGHATNVTTIGYLFGAKDLIVHDALIHNSALEGIRLSGAARRSFPHNDHVALANILDEVRHRFDRVLIVVEGIYSMDGDGPNLPAFVEIKRRHRTFLMVDEAHSLGVLGASGKGSHEHFGMAGTEVDIWMGTLSKTLASCGGYIAGSQVLIDLLKYGAPGFVYSVGISPALAAAALAALRIMQAEPERVRQINERTRLFLDACQAAKVNTGSSQGYDIVPAIVGSSLKATRLSNALFKRNINVQPIIYPAVEERSARLRFFLSAMHTETQIKHAVKTLASLL